MKNIHQNLLFLLGLLITSQGAFAGVTQLLYEETFGECHISSSHDAIPGGEGVLVIRAATKDQGICSVNQAQLDRVLEKGLLKLEENKDLAGISSIFLGRIHIYPWLSEFLVTGSRNNTNWDTKRGRAVTGSSNQYVNTLLSNQTITKPFSTTLAPRGYKLTGVSCEKVLLDAEKLPYDALCWITLK